MIVGARDRGPGQSNGRKVVGRTKHQVNGVTQEFKEIQVFHSSASCSDLSGELYAI
jgi:hypothetical protein